MLKFMTRYDYLVRAVPQNGNLKKNIPCMYHQIQQNRPLSTKNDITVKNSILLRCATSINRSINHHQHRQIYRKPPVISDNYNLVYEGPKSKGMKYLRWGTVFAATLAPFGHPLGALLGIITVFVVHKTSKPYVTKLYFDADSRKFITETYSLLGMPLRFKFHVSQIELPHVPSQERSTFRVLKQEFFLHYEVEEARQIFDFIREYNGDKKEETVVSEDKKDVQSSTEGISIAQTAATVAASQTVINASTENVVDDEIKTSNDEKAMTEETVNMPDLDAVDEAAENKVEEIIIDSAPTLTNDESVNRETIVDQAPPIDASTIDVGGGKD